MNAQRLRPRRGVTLLELLAVVTLMGIFAAIAIARFGPTLFGDFGSQADARRVSLALLQAKRQAITNGFDHAVQWGVDADGQTTYSVVALESGVAAVVDGPFAVSRQVQATFSHPQMVFNFEGQAAAPYSVRLSGAHRAWQIDAIPITGALQVQEVAP